MKPCKVTIHRPWIASVLFAGMTVAGLALAPLLVTTPAHADREAANSGHVITDTWGICYARSVPGEPYGNVGRTDVYRVGTLDEPDVLMASFDFFAQQMFLDCQVANDEGGYDVAVVGLGPWPRGYAPNDETLALALFLGGEEVARYSTLDISGGNPDAVSCTVSHYQVIDRADGFGRDMNGRDVFIVTTIDGRILSFDLVTGALLHSEQRLGHDGWAGECSAF